MKFIARGVIGHLIIAAYWPLIEAATVIAYCSRILRGMSDGRNRADPALVRVHLNSVGYRGCCALQKRGSSGRRSGLDEGADSLSSSCR